MLMLAFAPFAATACNSTTGPAVPSGVIAVSGNDQFATVSTSAANPLVVLVTDTNGNPSAGATVRWAITGGGGSLADTTSTSDQAGHASMTYTAGSNPGTATIVATVALAWTTTFTVYIESAQSAQRRIARAGSAQ